MFWASVVFFALAAVGGVTVATLHLKNKVVPLGLALAHGLAAAIGLVLLVILVATGSHSTLRSVALVLFIIVALGGFVLFALHMKKKVLPVPLIVVHGLAAVVSFVLLLISAVR